MKHADVEIGGVYMTKHAGRWVPVKVDFASKFCGFSVSFLSGQALPRFRKARELKVMSKTARVPE